MADRPILFMDEMVAAILAGRKTVTRRVGKAWAGVQPGTRLWVREAHTLVDHRCWSGLPCASTDVLVDPTDEDGPTRKVWAFYRTGFDRTFTGRWRPSIHMPRWASRIDLEVVSVTEQRGRVPWDGSLRAGWVLPDLDDDEARREGVADRRTFLAAWHAMHRDHDGPVYRIEFTRRTP